MIWIRADANKEIGSGHVMRCLSIAAALRKLEQQVCFLVADEQTVPLIETRGFEAVVLHTDYTQMEDEWNVLEQVLRVHGVGEADVFLLDSYYVTAEYIRKVKSVLPVAYMDDLGSDNLPANRIINYNIYAREEMYPGAEVCGAQLLLGTEYAPLREEFTAVNYRVREVAESVLITTGGSDKYNLAGQILERALAYKGTKDLHYRVISGAYNVHYDYLKELEEKNSNVQILKNVTNMSEIMSGSDIAVTAGGSTMYELSAIGVPILCFSFVENQEGIVKCFTERELVNFGGDFLNDREEMLDGLVEKLGELAKDTVMRGAYSEKLRRLVDGQGAMRIAKVLTGMSF